MPISLRENIYEAIKAEVLQCRLMPSSDLHEQALAERFAVSKSPVRDALLRLEQDGLVVVIPRQGYRVAPISLKDAREMFQLRKVLEAACADAAAAGAIPESVAKIEALRAFEGSNGSDAFIAYNRAFHLAICKASGNGRMARLACNTIEQMERMIRFSVNSVSVQDIPVLVKEHGAIIDAIVAGDRRRAARLVREHVTAAEKRVITGLERAAVRMHSLQDSAA